MRIDQECITAFGVLTDDVEPLHTDPDWCRDHSPVGTTIAYGFLTLSLLTKLLREATSAAFVATKARGAHPLNYGFDRVRFVSPVPVNARIRGHFTLAERKTRPDGEMMRFSVVVEIEGSDRPALTAEWWSMWVHARDNGAA